MTAASFVILNRLIVGIWTKMLTWEVYSEMHQNNEHHKNKPVDQVSKYCCNKKKQDECLTCFIFSSLQGNMIWVTNALIQAGLDMLSKGISAWGRSGKTELKCDQWYRVMTINYSTERKLMKVIIQESKRPLVAQNAQMVRNYQYMWVYQQNGIPRVDQKIFHK